ncbi:RevA protein [Nannizzia gypsea CBS 118893]|uniref:RevA protein n=1 Tax=Arthroderma gypseum (strain ATCC MYA-4604 / CBS 118893) TaxID=535722 RepID=E4UVU8_ARTGP|nr:RevA protein [Nannizzia gypsea CBS 118893]EFR02425.1 RevA protein [Nannizzia gypsea CBS 118893]
MAETNRLPDTYAALASSLSSFLAVSIHQIMYLRSIYPQPTFVSVRQFNQPVRQSRHPKVCSWVNDACAAVETQLLKSTVASVAIVILSVSSNRPMEKFTFDLSQIPQVAPGDIHTPFASSRQQPQQQQQGENKSISQVDLEAQFRAVLHRLSSACARLAPLPLDDEYLPTLHMVLRPDADAPAGMGKDDQQWIAAEPEPERARHGTTQPHARTVPVRTVDVGEMKLEVWIEEARSKFDTDSSAQ